MEGDGHRSLQKGQDMLTVNEVAELLHVHPNTVRHWSNLGQLPTYRLGPRGDRRFRRGEVDEFLETKRLFNVG